MKIKTTNDILFDSCNQFEIKKDYLEIKTKQWVAVDDIINLCDKHLKSRNNEEYDKNERNLAFTNGYDKAVRNLKQILEGLRTT